MSKQSQVFLNKILSKIQDSASRISSFSDLQTSWIFFTKVLKAKINHLLRTVPPEDTEDFATKFDNIIEETLLNIIGVSSLSEAQWSQAYLTIGDGGLGLSSNGKKIRWINKLVSEFDSVSLNCSFFTKMFL
jgi:hypothetical protein